MLVKFELSIILYVVDVMNKVVLVDIMDFEEGIVSGVENFEVKSCMLGEL